MAHEALKSSLRSISGINITPFDSFTREIRWEALDANIEFLVERGIDVIVPCGNTGEFFSLTIDEAREVTHRVARTASGRATIIAGVGYTAKTAIDLGRAAAQAGADAVMIHDPIQPFVTEAGAITYFREIITALDIPAILYFKNPHLTDRVIGELAPLDNLVAVKYAINDLPRFGAAVHAVAPEHGLVWICGTAEKWAPYFFAAGAVGFTSGLVNLFPEKSLEMLRALQNSDWKTVWTVWREVLHFENLRARYNNGNNVSVVKEAMNLIGLDAGITRGPSGPLSEEDRLEVRRILGAWGLPTR